MAEAQTLTYDSNEQPEGEFTPEEKEALEVGEKLVEQQEQMLAGKFKNAEELEQGYIELQKKLGENKEESEPTNETEKPESKEEETEEEINTDFLDTLWEESQNEWTKDTLEKLSNMNSRDVAQMYLQYRSEQPPSGPTITEDQVVQLKDVAGGEESYNQMMAWANQSLDESEVKMYDAVMDRGDPLAAFFAVQALAYRFNDARGVDGEMLTGKAPKNEGDTFKSQAQVVRAMSDPQYDKDPAYRQEIYEKLERSNLQF